MHNAAYAAIRKHEAHVIASRNEGAYNFCLNKMFSSIAVSFVQFTLLIRWINFICCLFTMRNLSLNIRLNIRLMNFVCECRWVLSGSEIWARKLLSAIYMYFTRTCKLRLNNTNNLQSTFIYSYIIYMYYSRYSISCTELLYAANLSVLRVKYCISSTFKWIHTQDVILYCN